MADTSTGNTPTTDALRAILAEVTPGIRPHSGDSCLPDHLIDAARLALPSSTVNDVTDVTQPPGTAEAGHRRYAMR